jgi:hypothetical protein
MYISWRQSYNLASIFNTGQLVVETRVFLAAMGRCRVYYVQFEYYVWDSFKQWQFYFWESSLFVIKLKTDYNPENTWDHKI